jgi:hypothetical protein
MARAIDIADDIAAACELLRTHGGHTRIVNALVAFLDGANFAASLGAIPGWRETIRIRRRDMALAALAQDFDEKSAYALAAAIAEEISSYHAGEWEDHYRNGRRPIGRRGFCYDFLLRSSPLSVDWLRHLLAGIAGCEGH